MSNNIDSTLLHPRQIQPTKSGYQSLEEQIEFGRFNSVLSGAAPTLHQEVISIKDQRTFVIPQGTYIMGDNSLQVFVNGQYMRSGVDNDYIEIDNRTIEFTFGLDKDDVVVFRVNGGKSGPSLHEIHTAAEGQTTIALNASYSVGNDSLVVFINGAYQTIGKDYIEVDSKTVDTIEPLEEGDTVVFRVEGLPSEIKDAGDFSVQRTFDALNRLVKEEKVGDGIHTVVEYYRDAQGRPERMVTKEAGYTVTRTYTYVGDNCVNIEQTVMEGA